MVRDGSPEWSSVLRGPPTPARDDALAELQRLLLRAARFELSRRRGPLTDVGVAGLDVLAHQAADDALIAILSNLDAFRDTSRFTTWATKFALREAGVLGRRRAWRDRARSLDREACDAPAVLCDAVRSSLTPDQREIFTALALDGIPIDVLAERRATTRGALYRSLREARHELRSALAEVAQAG